jgi:hypothetical protein
MKNLKCAIAALTIFLGAANCFAQQKNTSRIWQFHSINNIGLIEGETGSACHLQTINGLQKKSWFGGIGVGLDYYRFRSIPLFADVRKEFGKRENKFFLYADAGFNYYWKRDKDVKQFYFGDQFKNGFYGEVGFGYKFKLNSKLNFMLAGGYSYKKLTEKGENFFDYPGGPLISNSENNNAKVVYNFNRLSLKLGIEF